MQKRLTKLIAICSCLIFLSITSCEDSPSGQVEIKLVPSTPSVGTFSFETDEETIEAPWIELSLYFSNPTSDQIVISKVSVGYRIGDQTEFTELSDLTPHDAAQDGTFVILTANSSGFEYQYLSLNANFNRYLYGMAKDEKYDGNYNYYMKLEFQGYFRDTTTSTPTEAFNKTLYFRTKTVNVD